MTTLQDYRIKTLRKKSEMARLLNVSITTYSALEKGDSKSAVLIQNILDLIVGSSVVRSTKVISAQYTRFCIDRYRDENPNATWLEIYKAVPNNYGTDRIMQCCYSKYQRKNGRTNAPAKTSKYRGVSKRRGYITASINIHHRNTHLGMFKTELEAAHAYDQAVLKHFGYEGKTNITEGNYEL